MTFFPTGTWAESEVAMSASTSIFFMIGLDSCKFTQKATRFQSVLWGNPPLTFGVPIPLSIGVPVPLTFGKPWRIAKGRVLKAQLIPRN